MEIGGNRITLWIGRRMKNWGEKLINKGNPLVISNPTVKMPNPFTLIVSFTVNNTEKYQVVLQGQYGEKYKQSDDGIPNISEEEMFLLISHKKGSWFKKK